MNQETILELIHKLANDTATDAEREMLMSWYREKGYQDTAYPDAEDVVEKRMLSRLLQEIPRSKTSKAKVWAIAASVALALGFGVFYYEFNSNKQKTAQLAQNHHMIKPGGNKAVLTLANGSKIVLDEAGKGTIAYQKGMQIVKSASGHLAYNASNHNHVSANGKPEFNVIETPKGGQYQVVLPDGSRVWLNAESSIRFPVSFAALKERRVELDGEAYFEVTHHADQPFRVSSGGQLVEVLGTHFDIMSYDKQKGIKTTLLQGSVKVSGTEAGKAVLKPGQQSTFVNDRPITVAAANIDQVIAWKNGFFRFDDERLEDIMTAISRWYDFNPVFEDEALKDEKFGAFTARFADITPLLNMMSRTGNVKFVVRGKNIHIMRKK